MQLPVVIRFPSFNHWSYRSAKSVSRRSRTGTWPCSVSTSRSRMPSDSISTCSRRWSGSSRVSPIATIAGSWSISWPKGRSPSWSIRRSYPWFCWRSSSRFCPGFRTWFWSRPCRNRDRRNTCRSFKFLGICKIKHL